MKIILFFLFSLISIAASAQNELPTGQIEVVKDFEVRLTETKKIKIIPQPLIIDTSSRHYEYTLLAPAPAIEYEVAELKPLSIEPEQKPVYYPFYAKAGYGSPNSLLALVSYDHDQNENFGWGVDFRHLSADNKKIPLQKFSETEATVNGSVLLSESVLLDGKIGGQFENVYFYGADVIPTNPDALKRSFTRYDAHFEISNTPVENTSFRYTGIFQYLFDKDDLGSRERGFKLGGEGDLLLGQQEFPIGLKLLADFSRLKDNHERAINNILVEPYFQYYTGDLKIRAGAIALLKTDENELMPALELTYKLFPLISLRLGWQGEVQKNNFHYLSAYNPYIITRLDSINNMVSRQLFGGVKGISGIFQYEASIGYTKFKNMAFFLQDIDDQEQFVPVYDNGSYIGIKGSLIFEALKYVTIRSNAYMRFYSLDNEEKPWHRPSFGIDAQGTYTGGEDTYHVSLLFHGENGLPYRTPGGTELSLDPLIDLNLHGDYFFTPFLGAFAQLNNILGNNRERWAGYPSYGFNAKAGIMLRM